MAHEHVLQPPARRGQLLCVAVDLHDVEIVEAVAALREDPEDDDAPGFFSTTDPQAWASRFLEFLPAFAGRFFSGEIAGDIAIVVSFGCIAAYSLPSCEALS